MMKKITRKKPDTPNLINNFYEDLIEHYKELIANLKKDLEADSDQEWAKKYLEKLNKQLEKTLLEKENFNKNNK